MTDREFWEDAYREDPDDAIVEDLILENTAGESVQGTQRFVEEEKLRIGGQSPATFFQIFPLWKLLKGFFLNQACPGRARSRPFATGES